MDIIGLTSLFKYILVGIGLLGFIVLIIGLIKAERELIQRGVYLIIISIVLTLTSMFLIKKAEERVIDYIPEYYEESEEFY